MKITIIGAGNIGGAIAKGLLLKEAISPSELTLTTRHEQTLEKYECLGCNLTQDNLSAVKGADIVMLALKPYAVEDVINQIKYNLDYEKQMIVSIVAGIESKDMVQMFDRGDGKKVRLVYTIPNTAIEIGESYTFITPVTVNKDEVKSVRELFNKLGKTKIVDEKLIVAGTSLASCGIAYAMRYARAATLGGVQLGFKSKDALEIVEQTVIGAMRLLEAHGSHPEAEIDNVTTPAGITINGLIAMEDAGFTTSVISGLRASKATK